MMSRPGDCRGEGCDLEWMSGVEPVGPEGLLSAAGRRRPLLESVAGKVRDHWVLWGLSGGARSLPENVPADETLADGATQGENSFGRIGYGGPCPPGGETHECVFVLYALDSEVEPSGPTKTDLLTAVEGHVLSESTLRGTSVPERVRTQS